MMRMVRTIKCCYVKRPSCTTLFYNRQDQATGDWEANTHVTNPPFPALGNSRPSQAQAMRVCITPQGGQARCRQLFCPSFLPSAPRKRPWPLSVFHNAQYVRLLRTSFGYGCHNYTVVLLLCKIKNRGKERASFLFCRLLVRPRQSPAPNVSVDLSWPQQKDETGDLGVSATAPSFP